MVVLYCFLSGSATENTREDSGQPQHFEAVTPVPEDFDPATASYDEQLALLYKKIKNPDPEDDEETISRRKRMLAETRAQQMKEQAREQAPARAKEKSKKKWWHFWKK